MAQYLVPLSATTDFVNGLLRRHALIRSEQTAGRRASASEEPPPAPRGSLARRPGPGLGAAGAPSPSEVAPRHAGLTRLRFVFIGWVVLYHLDILLRVTEFLPWLRPVLGVGYLGVDGFFLLSGFALWLGYGAKPPAGLAGAGRFLLRRVAKIWPLHAVALLALAALVGSAVALGAEVREPDRFDLRGFLLQLGLVHALEPTSRHAWNSPSWALSAEWAGYLVGREKGAAATVRCGLSGQAKYPSLRA